MPIKQRNAITKADFEEALDYLGSSISEVAKATNVPRAYLSDLKNRNVRLRREHEDKLRSFLEHQGVELEAVDRPPQRSGTNATPPHPDLEYAAVPQFFIPIARELDDDAVRDALDAAAELDEDIGGLLRAPVESGVFDPFSDTFDKLLADAQRLMAAHYLISRFLRGLPGVDGQSPDDKPETLADVLVKKCQSELERAGLANGPSEKEDAQPEAA